MFNGTDRIPWDFGHLAALGVHDNAAAAAAYAALALDHAVIAVELHFAIDVDEFELRHDSSSGSKGGVSKGFISSFF